MWCDDQVQIRALQDVVQERDVRLEELSREQLSLQATLAQHLATLAKQTQQLKEWAARGARVRSSACDGAHGHAAGVNWASRQGTHVVVHGSSLRMGRCCRSA